MSESENAQAADQRQSLSLSLSLSMPAALAGSETGANLAIDTQNVPTTFSLELGPVSTSFYQSYYGGYGHGNSLSAKLGATFNGEHVEWRTAGATTAAAGVEHRHARVGTRLLIQLVVRA